MHEKNYTGLIPPNKEGKEITAEAVKTFSSAEAAKLLYASAKQKLLTVNEWGKIAGGLSAKFQLTNNNGDEVNRCVQKQDHFKVDITGPGTKAGEGYDWVIVEDVKEVNEDDLESIAIRVRPSQNPQTEDTGIAHFYSAASTSTFTVTREGSTVTASIYDRNIEANTDTEKTADKLRNTIIGLGAKYGFSKLQWKALADALLEK